MPDSGPHPGEDAPLDVVNSGTTARKGGRPEQPAALDDRPWFDDLGVLRHGDEWIALSPVQEAVVRTLLTRFGSPVARSEVEAAVWPANSARRPRDPHAVDLHIHRLRRRLKEVGLIVHTLRGRGFLLEAVRD